MSIRARLLGIVAVATIVPAVLLGLRFFEERERAIASATERLIQAADGLAIDLEERVLGAAQLLYGLSRARDLDTTDREACSAFLSEVRARYPQYTGILTVDPAGLLFCDSLQTGRDLDLNDRRYVQQARQRARGVVVQAAIGRLTGTPVIQVAYPHRRADGSLAFTLLASISLPESLRSHRRREAEGLDVVLVDAMGVVQGWSAAVMPPGGVGSTIAATPLGRYALSRDPARSATVRETDGTAAIWASASRPLLAEAGLRVLVGQGRPSLVAGANRRLWQDLTGLLITSLGLGLAIWLIGEVAVRRQVRRIGVMAERLGQGDLSARIPPPFPGGELGELMVEMNRSAEALQRQQQAIAELNQQLTKAQRLQAVGQLTGGLAHDFNNLLTVILGSADLLEEQLADRPDLQELAEATRKAAERGGELTRSLVAFARRQPLEPRATELGAAIQRMDTLLRRTLGEHISCKLVLAPRLPPALVDPAQLDSALLNLVLNARDAMPQGGVLTLETSIAELDATAAALHEEVAPGIYLVIAVSDTGTGMPPEVVARAFEPFFTTKVVGQGSGLGLSMVYGFIKQSRGHIQIYSEPGQGTTVKLYLPRADVALAIPARLPERVPRGHETVLAVEDDGMVRTHVVAELRQLGYRVLAAANAQEALDILRAEVPIDLLFTDVVMPGGVHGPQLAQQARALRPGLRVLFTSGYTENAIVHHGTLDAGVLLLSKPYRRQELAQKLRQALEHAAFG
jgi:signal transduction histidine kinase/ActR/RegA family two-component response regulator